MNIEIRKIFLKWRNEIERKAYCKFFVRIKLLSYQNNIGLTIKILTIHLLGIVIDDIGDILDLLLALLVASHQSRLLIIVLVGLGSRGVVVVVIIIWSGRLGSERSEDFLRARPHHLSSLRHDGLCRRRLDFVVILFVLVIVLLSVVRLHELAQ